MAALRLILNYLSDRKQSTQNIARGKKFYLRLHWVPYYKASLIQYFSL